MELKKYNELAAALLARQQHDWPLLAANYKALESVEVKNITVGSETIRVQYNPARIFSSAAKVDPESIQRRPCFLCASHLFPEQEKLAIHPLYWLLCNPYPIFREHFTLPSRHHKPQLIRRHFPDFLRLAKYLTGYTLFYNGPHCGASAPDHLHFQAVTSGVMPLEQEVAARLSQGLPIVKHEGSAVLYSMTGYLRNGFVLRTSVARDALRLFDYLYTYLLRYAGAEEEPRMNLLALYNRGEWLVILIPRRAHRPWQYSASGDDCFFVSPGAADIGGCLVVPRREDFEKVTVGLLKSVYEQVCWSGDQLP